MWRKRAKESGVVRQNLAEEVRKKKLFCVHTESSYASHSFARMSCPWDLFVVSAEATPGDIALRKIASTQAGVGEKKRGGRGAKRETSSWWLSAPHTHTHTLRLYRCFVISSSRLPLRRTLRRTAARESATSVCVCESSGWFFLGEKKNLFCRRWQSTPARGGKIKWRGGNQQTKRDDETNTNAKRERMILERHDPVIYKQQHHKSSCRGGPLGGVCMLRSSLSSHNPENRCFMLCPLEFLVVLMLLVSEKARDTFRALQNFIPKATSTFGGRRRRKKRKIGGNIFTRNRKKRLKIEQATEFCGDALRLYSCDCDVIVSLRLDGDFFLRPHLRRLCVFVSLATEGFFFGGSRNPCDTQGFRFMYMALCISVLGFSTRQQKRRRTGLAEDIQEPRTQ